MKLKFFLGKLGSFRIMRFNKNPLNVAGRIVSNKKQFCAASLSFASSVSFVSWAAVRVFRRASFDFEKVTV